MIRLIFQAGRHAGHGIRPHSLKVTTISTLMTEIAKGNAKFPRLTIRRNYRAIAAQDAANVYSRNLPHREIFVSRSAQGPFKENRNAEPLTTDPPEISDGNQIGENL